MTKSGLYVVVGAVFCVPIAICFSLFLFGSFLMLIEKRWRLTVDEWVNVVTGWAICGVVFLALWLILVFLWEL